MAGKFRFRLEVVRRVRKQAQDAQRRVVADAVESIKKLESRIGQLTSDLHRTMDRTRDARRPHQLDLSSLRRHQVYRGCIHGWLLESANELAERQAALDGARSKLAETTKRYKAIEKLRERKWASHVHAFGRAEQVGYDEMAAVRYVRARGACRAGGDGS